MKFNFTINTLFLSVLGLFIGYNMLSYYLTPTNIYQPPIGTLPVPIEVGRSKIYVSKERDASMATENRRRRAIIGSNSGPIKKFGYSGSTNGSLETFFLSSIWPTGVPYNVPICTSIFDGGNAESEFCYIIDGNGDAIIVDGGYADTNVCSA